MHELHLAEDILRKINERAAEENKTQLTFVKVAIGQSRFTHMDELKELLSAVAKGTAADGAKIEFEVVPIKTICAACQKDFNPKEMRIDCPNCGSTNIKITTGNELAIKELN